MIIIYYFDSTIYLSVKNLCAGIENHGDKRRVDALVVAAA